MDFNFQIKFKNINEAISVVNEFDKRGYINWDKFSESFIKSHFEWTNEEYLQFIHYFNQKINFNSLCNNKEWVWSLDLLEIYKDYIDWHSEIFYEKQLPELTIEIIDRFSEYWNWKLLGRFGLVRRDVSLFLLEKYRCKWSYTKEEDVDVDVDDGQVTAVYPFLHDDSIFNNVNIPWYRSDYKLAFTNEIELYKNHLFKFETKTNHKHSLLIFEEDQFDDLPF